MKTINIFVMSALLMMGSYGIAMAENGQSAVTEVQNGEVMVHQCPKCQYTTPDNCPMCGMKMEKKQMSAADAQRAIDKSKAEMRNRA